MVEERILTINNILKNYNWQFIHPYIQEYQIDIILSRYSANSRLSKEQKAIIIDWTNNAEDSLDKINP